MTDREYEKMMVEAALGKEQIRLLDIEIKHHAQLVDNLMERRRELINRFNLNKGRTISDDFDGDYRNGDFYEGAE